MVDPDIFRLSHEVESALADGRPVVALESSVISQGLPRPKNLAAAIACEQAVRDAGAVPATIAVVDGLVRVGLDRPDLDRLAGEDGIGKAGARDLGWAVTTGATLATTVGATITIAHAVNIAVMATGGVGGIHRGYEHHADASHDLTALAQTPVVVVSAGFKSILDLPRTLEVLETMGVAVVGFGTSRLPDFYSRDSGFEIPRANDARQVASMLRSQVRLGLSSAIVVANPPPVELSFARGELHDMVTKAVQASAAAGVAGKSLTPYLLGQIATLSGGRSIELNVALLLSNARVGAEIAGAVALEVSRAES